MSGLNSDQLHRSTLGIYSSLMDDFNPSLQKLVSLGNSYIQAFQALAVKSEAYFNALSKIGEMALHTISSHSLGDVVIQMAANQRRLTSELEGIFHWFQAEVLQEMDNNIRLDKDYIASSRKRYEMEVHNQAVALERQLRRGTNQDHSEYVQFLRESHREALKEEERRYRFVAEKHGGLIQSIAQLMNKNVGSLQKKADTWSEEVNATRRPETKQPTSVDNTVGMKEEEFRKNKEEQLLGTVPSRAPSPFGRVSRSGSVVDSVSTGGRSVRALVAHQPGGSDATLLNFKRGEMITVLVPQSRNGWLYGCAESSARQGWFPASFVEGIDDGSKLTSSRTKSSSMSNLLDQPGSSSNSAALPPAPPPPPSQMTQSAQPAQVVTDKRPESSSEKKRPQPHQGRPELFPKGTNPFATVKLKPTSTNDRSAPRLRR
ncbi:brain-specific angiogenesis inhibitor 1-associated protein 2-like protein 2 [Sphaeramia orbicularis]|uniref:brain-specific angiogenesis inhibitor 1-associated protein 2-like protein 2 n=1 Tax=Sphaeramia orbicularis TaxID=375764 RepID=UPI00117EA60A|nr:brain-specific angiogenesis inhibitor 1-associated protein 2-like protein 2 [Sphaeramia orbicularis]